MNTDTSTQSHGERTIRSRTPNPLCTWRMPDVHEGRGYRTRPAARVIPRTRRVDRRQDRVPNVGHRDPNLRRALGDETHDEQLPEAEAFESVAEKLAERAAQLPGVVPVFNFKAPTSSSKGCGGSRAGCIIWEPTRSRRRSQRARGRKPRSARDKAALESRRRRLEKITRHERSTDRRSRGRQNLVRCTWEQKHPDEDCPICDNPDAAKVHGLEGSAKDSQQHVEDAEQLAAKLKAEELADAVEEAAGIKLSLNTVMAWSVEDQDAVREWVATRTRLDSTRRKSPARST